MDLSLNQGHSSKYSLQRDVLQLVYLSQTQVEINRISNLFKNTIYAAGIHTHALHISDRNLLSLNLRNYKESGPDDTLWGASVA